MDALMDGWMEGRMDGSTDGRMEGWMDMHVPIWSGSLWESHGLSGFMEGGQYNYCSIHNHICSLLPYMLRKHWGRDL